MCVCVFLWQLGAQWLTVDDVMVGLVACGVAFNQTHFQKVLFSPPIIKDTFRTHTVNLLTLIPISRMFLIDAFHSYPCF